MSTPSAPRIQPLTETSAIRHPPRHARSAPAWNPLRFPHAIDREPLVTPVDPAETDTAPVPALQGDALFAEVYDRLKAMASRQLAARARDSLDTTAVVHELYLRFGAKRNLAFAERAQFFAYAARAMRHLLLDRARDRKRLHAGGGWHATTLDGDDARLALESAEEALALVAALEALAATDPRAAQVVELRYFAGLSLEQVAELLALGRRTVDRDWQYARAFLHAALG